jgi:hypothetical protein
MFEDLANRVDDASFWSLSTVVLVGLLVAAAIGMGLRAYHDRIDRTELPSGQEAYIVSAVLGLLALLMAFTFSLAIDRFEIRRSLVVEDANAIRTAYLQVQVLGEPHRSRLSALLITHTANVIQLAEADRHDRTKLLTADDRLLADLWSATLVAFDSIRALDFSNTFVSSMSNVVDLDASRRVARLVHLPAAVLIVLLLYLLVTAALLGYVLKTWRIRIPGSITLVLLALSFVLVIYIDHPPRGIVHEIQGPMEQLLSALRSQPPRTFTAGTHAFGHS